MKMIWSIGLGFVLFLLVLTSVSANTYSIFDRYQDESGEWKYVNKTAVFGNWEGYDYKITEGHYHVYYKEYIYYGDAIKYCKDNYCFTIQPSKVTYRNQYGSNDDIDSSPLYYPGYPVDNMFVWEDIFTDMKLSYTYNNINLKEELELYNKPREPAEYLGEEVYLEFDTYIKFPVGVHMYVNDTILTEDIVTGRKIEFRNESGEILYFLPEPYAYDSNGTVIHLEYKIEWDGKYNGNKERLMWFSVRVPYEFINNSIYPIYIDPSVSTNAIEGIKIANLQNNIIGVLVADETQDDISMAIYYTNGTVIMELTDLADTQPVDQYNEIIDIQPFDEESFIVAYPDTDNGYNIKIVHIGGNSTLLEDSTSSYDYQAPRICVLENRKDYIVSTVYGVSGSADVTLFLHDIYGTDHDDIIIDDDVDDKRDSSIACFGTNETVISWMDDQDQDKMKLSVHHISNNEISTSDHNLVVETYVDYNNYVVALNSTTFALLYFDTDDDDHVLNIYDNDLNPIDIDNVVNDYGTYRAGITAMNNSKMAIITRQGSSPYDYLLDTYDAGGNSLSTTLSVNTTTYSSQLTGGWMDVTSYDVPTGYGLCNDGIAVAFVQDSNDVFWAVYNSTAGTWDGNCPEPISEPQINLDSIYVQIDKNLSGNDSIWFNWSVLGNYTRSWVWRNGTVVYNDTDMFFNNTGLTNNTGYHFNITAYYNESLQNSTVFDLNTTQNPECTDDNACPLCYKCSSGSCVVQTAEEDTKSECGVVQCDDGADPSYYDAWDTLICYYKADEPDGTCDGAGACKVASDYCSDNAQGDSTAIECACQGAQIGCADTTIGSCDDGLCQNQTLTPTSLAVDSYDNQSVYVTFTSAIDDYQMYKNNDWVANISVEYYNYTGLTPNTEYCFNITAHSFDYYTTVSNFSNTVCQITNNNTIIEKPSIFDVRWNISSIMVNELATIFANATITDGTIDTVIFELTYPNLTAINYTGTRISSAGNSIMCYQETANETSDCGGLDSGNYYGVEDFASDLDWLDGVADDQNTGGGMANSYGYVNYTIPNGAQDSSIWEVCSHDEGCFNYTLNQCEFNTVLQLRLYVSAFGISNQAQCWNGTDWEEATPIDGKDGDGGFSEERMYWNITTESTLTNQYHYNLSETSQSGYYNITRIFANTTTGLINNSYPYTALLVNATTDTCSYDSGDWAIDCSDMCLIEDNVDLGGNDLSIIGTGITTITSDITDCGNVHIRGTDNSNRCIVKIIGGKLCN